MDHWLRSAKRQKVRREAQAQSHPDAAYVQRLQAGEQAAWEQFVAEWSPGLYRYTRCLLGNDDQAQAIVSDTLLAIVQAISRCDDNVILSTLLFTIAYRKIINARPWQSSMAETPVALKPAGGRPTRLALLAALATLPIQEQQVLLLHYQVGLSVVEIAEILACSNQTAVTLISHVRHQFEIAFLGSAEP
jgi:DNA-directed RNA polymerase specialized sigma24 family protein